MEFGFSLYPAGHSLDDLMVYIDRMVSYGATSLFISLLADDFGRFPYDRLVSYARSKGLAVVADISPEVVEKAGWHGNLLASCQSLGLSGIRLDEALSLEEMVALTKGADDFFIELNMSTRSSLLDQLIESGANRTRIRACHNFYPRSYTGLSRSYFLEQTRFYRSRGIQTAAFVCPQTGREGPWSISEGLPTLEDLRHCPLSIQVAALKATGLLDRLILSTQFIKEDELAAFVAALSDETICLPYYPLVEMTEVEEELLDRLHTYRVDGSDWMIRSSSTRLYVGGRSIPPRVQSKVVTRGAIVMDNDAYLRYKGEVHILLKELQLTSKTNHLGQLTPDGMIVLDYLQPGQQFSLQPVQQQSSVI